MTLHNAGVSAEYSWLDDLFSWSSRSAGCLQACIRIVIICKPVVNSTFSGQHSIERNFYVCRWRKERATVPPDIWHVKIKRTVYCESVFVKHCEKLALWWCGLVWRLGRSNVSALHIWKRITIYDQISGKIKPVFGELLCIIRDKAFELCRIEGCYFFYLERIFPSFGFL